MSDHELYREHILEHYRHPQNTGTLQQKTHHAKNLNPLCGDSITVDIHVVDGRVKDIKFKGVGCAISTASGSLLTEEIKGKTVQEVLAMRPSDVTDLLAIPVGAVRLKCALLSLETIQKALQSPVIAQETSHTKKGGESHAHT